MACLLVESFDWITVGSSSGDLTTIFDQYLSSHNTTSTNAEAIEFFNGGTAIRLRELDQFLRFNVSRVPTATDEVGIGAWVRWGSTTTSDVFQDGRIIRWIDSNGSTPHMTLRIDNGQLQMRRGDGGTETSLGFAPLFDRWYFVEMKQVVNNTTGSWEVQVDGVSIGSATSVDTNNGGNGIAQYVEIYCSVNGNRHADFGGVIAWDDNGGDLVDFPGITNFKCLRPDADGDDEAWTTSSGTDSFALVDEAAIFDDDTTYIESSTSAQRTLFTYEDLSTNYTDVLGLQISSVVRETDATDFSVINALKQNSINYPESSQAIPGQTFGHLFNVLDQDPDTSIGWTVSGVNSLQAGIELV
jgi:hypothetical protein